MGQHALVPRVRGLSLKVTTPLGFTYYVIRSGVRYFVTGNPIDGRRRDNATFRHDATVDYRGDPVPRYSRARWRRVARRNALVGIPGTLLSLSGASEVVQWLGLEPGWSQVPWDGILGGYVSLGLAGGTAYAYPKVRRYVAEHEVRRELIHPATRVACQILNTRWDRRTARSMLQLSPGFLDADEDADSQPYAVLYVPPVPLDKNTKARITSNVGARLGLADAQGEWQEYGGRAWVRITGADVPPRKVELSEAYKIEDGESTTLRAAIESATMDRPVVGVASGGRIVHADLGVDPHVAASGGTGTGKSTLLRLIYTQRMRNGSGLLVLDLKGISHPFAYRVGRNRAVVAYKIEDIHEACVALGEELYRRRNEAVRAVQDGRPAPEFRKLDVIVEEANSLIPSLIAYWTARRKEIQTENKYELESDEYADVTEPPLRSPAVDSLGFGIQMGRELGIHLAYAGQRLSAAAFGGQGGDRRESFGERYLSKWQRQTWKMLVSSVPYRVPPAGPTGIWARVTGDSVDMIRVPYLSVDMAVDMINASPDPGQPVLPDLSFVSVSGGQARTIEGEAVQVSTDPLAAVRGVRVKLSEAVDRLPGDTTVKALRMAREKDETFPDPVEVGGPGRADLYDLAELIAWQAARRNLPLRV